MSLLQKQLYILEAARSFLTKQAYLSDLCVEIQQIAAPTNAEQKRAAWVETFFQKLGLEDIFQDEVHNVYARIPGQNATSTPALLVSAHTDTVFPMETDLSIRIDPATHWIHGPAIGDNSAGVAGLVALAQLLMQMRANGAAPPVDIWLVANTGEEGLGDLRGMRGERGIENGREILRANGAIVRQTERAGPSRERVGSKIDRHGFSPFGKSMRM